MTTSKNTPTKSTKAPPPAPKVGTSKVHAHPKPNDPKHEEWVIDETIDESFPASDAPSHTPPKEKKAVK